MEKITTKHLERGAYIYVRQSTMDQVQHNLESKRLQYRLDERARELGWPMVTVIDDDLGCSASGSAKREGFERLLSEVCQEKVGAIFAIEASRLARNGREWHTLMEVCALVDTLLIDPEGVYSPKLSNDRLLLGMKGTISEMELGLFRERCQAAIKAKARRGEYYNNLPVGYNKTASGGIEKDPDLRIQTALEHIFAKFAEFGSVRQATMWYRQEGIKVPVVHYGEQGRHVMWRIPGSETLLHVLRNPIYAGAYVYGRRKKKTILENGRKRIAHTYNRDYRSWDILLPNHHEGYISWECYEFNQETIKNNANMMGEVVPGAAKGGASLLTGILRCGHCGRKMSVSYEGTGGKYIRYNCNKNTTNIDGERCISFAAQRVERAISEALLDALQPLGVEASLEAAMALDAERQNIVKYHELNLEQARFECERIRRQYEAIEPENRLVARQLETRWNHALTRVTELEKEVECVQSAQSPITEKDRKELSILGQDLPRVWWDPSTSPELKKRIVRAVLKEVVVTLGERSIRLILHWEGGDHSEINLPRLLLAESRCQIAPDTKEALSKLARIMPDKRIAQVLNRLGKRTARGLLWNRSRISAVRNEYLIPVYQQGEQIERGEINLSDAAKLLEVHPRIVRALIDNGTLSATQPCHGAPWIIRKVDLESENIRSVIQQKHLKPPLLNQQTLNFQ